MVARKWAVIAVGLVLMFFGIIFALQGVNVLKGSAVMSGNPTYIYVGNAMAVFGLLLIIAAAASKPGAPPASTPAGSGPSSRQRQSAHEPRDGGNATASPIVVGSMHLGSRSA